MAQVTGVGKAESFAASELLHLYGEIASEASTEEVLRQSALAIVRALPSERATVYQVIEETQELESIAVIGNVSRPIRIPIRRSSLAGYCASECEAFLVPDAYGDLSAVSGELRFDPSWDKMNSFRTRDVMCVPAEFQGGLLGVVQALNSTERPFDAQSLKKLQMLTRLVSFALHHARMYEELASLKCLKKQKAQFMRVMVHELKSPVSAAKMLA
ncbi:MAG: GAF domain-containing protein, partial [Lentisphaerae bacterium]|nr:GAF domain-containing protein [Lentisphaerota bacterium]